MLQMLDLFGLPAGCCIVLLPSFMEGSIIIDSLWLQVWKAPNSPLLER
jgi:hypothetical protein